MIKNLKYSMFAMLVALGGCGCTVQGPISEADIKLDAYKYGITAESEYFDFRIGSKK